MDIRIHDDRNMGQSSINTYYHVSVPADTDRATLAQLISPFFFARGYFGAGLEYQLPSTTDGRQHWRVAAYKD